MEGTIDPAQWLLFARVARAGGVRLAAERTGLPRSTVSRRLAELEAQLGLRLFQRSSRALALTEEGRVVLERVGPVLDALGDAESAARALRERPTGTLRLACTGLFAELFLAPVLERYARRYPEVKLELVLEDRVVDLAREGFDCALRMGPLRDSTLVARTLGAGSFGVYAAPAYLRARGEPQRPKELAAHDAVVFSGRKDAERWPFLVRGRRQLVPVHAKYAVNSFRLVRDLAAAGLGVALLPRFLAREAGAALREVLSEHALPPGTVLVVYPSGRHLAPRTRAFVDLLAAHFATVRLGE